MEWNKNIIMLMMLGIYELRWHIQILDPLFGDSNALQTQNIQGQISIKLQ